MSVEAVLLRIVLEVTPIILAFITGFIVGAREVSFFYEDRRKGSAAVRKDGE